MIFISTGGFSQRTAYASCLELYEYGIRNFELSGGKPSISYLKDFKNFEKDALFQVHNYFPPPKEPFVLNLASLDEKIVHKSKEHILNSIKLCKVLGSKYYSFHAGFLIDPKVDELGKKVGLQKLNDRQKSLSLFIERVNEIDAYAQELNIEILIENNVISKNNAIRFKSNPFLMANCQECIEIMQNTSSNVNLLIDVGHLNVSSNSLNFSREVFLKKCDKWIKGYHFSDNDGTSDSNLPINNDSWFWPFIKKNLEYYSLEIYKHGPDVLKKQLEIAINKLK